MGFNLTTIIDTCNIVLGKQLLCEHEVGNIVDQYAIAVKNDTGITVGHLPQNIVLQK